MSARRGGTRIGVGIAAAVSLALAWAVAGIAPEARGGDEAKPGRLLGKVRSVAKGSFELVSRGALHLVTTATSTAYVKAAGTTLAKLDGSAVQMVCKRVPGYRDPATGAQIPPNIAQILAVVAGGPFSPPADTSGLPGGVQWTDGTVSGKKAGLSLDGVKLNVGPDRASWVLSAGAAGDVKKEGLVLAEGESRKDGKLKIVTATRIIVIDPAAPVAEVEFLYGPQM